MAAAARTAEAPTTLAPGLPPLDTSPYRAPRKGAVGATVRFFTRTLRYGTQGGPFLALLRSEAHLVSEAASMLSRCVGANAPVDALPQCIPLKGRARELERALTTDLRETPFAPLTQEDIHAISVTLNRILKGVVDVATLPLELPRSTVAALCETSNCCAKAVCGAIATLPGGKRMAAHTTEIARRAREAEFLVRSCEADLVAGERNPIRLLKRRHASRALRSLFRRYRETAHALEYAILRNG